MEMFTKASEMMVPDADQVKTSICPGVSNSTYLSRKGDWIKLGTVYNKQKWVIWEK